MHLTRYEITGKYRSYAFKSIECSSNFKLSRSFPCADFYFEESMQHNALTLDAFAARSVFLFKFAL